MKNKKILFVGVALLGITALAGCNPTTSSSTSGGGESTTSDGGSTTSSSQLASEVPVNRVSLKMSVQYQDAKTRMAFTTSTPNLPYTDINGKNYRAGDLKPVWQAVSDNLNLAIEDVTPKDRVSGSFTDWVAQGFDKVDVFQGGSAQIQNHATTNAGDILDLAQYLDRMPAFKAFLESNDVVRKSITTYDGNIYYSPYFDGYDDAEKMILMRVDMVKKLLDGELPANLDTSSTLTSSYEAYMPNELDTQVTVMKADNASTETINKKYTAGNGIIARQEKIDTKNGTELVKALREYIDVTYDGYYGTNRSDLFVGSNAAYDADELVALYRCIRYNSEFLTGKTDVTVTPLYNREAKNSRVSDLFALMGQMYGVRGLVSRSGFLYVDSDGTINDARWQEDTVAALDRFHQMYEEGLILQNFTDSGAAGTSSGTLAAALHAKNAGFSTFDYVQTQTAMNNTYARADKTTTYIAGYDFEPVIAPMAKWNGKSEYTRFQESWRSVKTEGWALSGHLSKPENADKLDRALTLFNYFWTEEGSRLMSYGPDQYLAHNGDGSIATISYMGKEVPQLHPTTLEQLANPKIGNDSYTNYYRYYLGGTFPIGYVKEQGMEYQCNVVEGKRGLDKVESAYALGVIENPDVTWTAEDKWYWICPTTFAFDAADATAVTNQYTALNSDISYDSEGTNVWTNYVQYGFGYSGGTITTFDKAAYITQYKTTLKGDQYVDIFNTAFQDMI